MTYSVHFWLNPAKVVKSEIKKNGDSLCDEIRRKMIFTSNFFIDLIPPQMNSPNFWHFFNNEGPSFIETTWSLINRWPMKSQIIESPLGATCNIQIGSLVDESRRRNFISFRDAVNFTRICVSKRFEMPVMPTWFFYKSANLDNNKSILSGKFQGGFIYLVGARLPVDSNFRSQSIKSNAPQKDDRLEINIEG